MLFCRENRLIDELILASNDGILTYVWRQVDSGAGARKHGDPED